MSTLLIHADILVLEHYLTKSKPKIKHCKKNKNCGRSKKYSKTKASNLKILRQLQDNMLRLDLNII